MKIYLFLLIPVLLLAQAKQNDWSDKTVNYPTSKDDSTSLMYADPGEKITSDQYNKLLRAIRTMQDKVGIGASVPGYAGQLLKVALDGSSTEWSTNQQDADSIVWREDIHDSLGNVLIQMDDSSGVIYVDSSCTEGTLQTIFDGLDNLNTKIVFKRGTYSFSGRIIARNVKNLVIEGNGAYLNINGDPSNDVISFYSWECNASGSGYSTTSDFQANWFTTNLLEDSCWVGVDDTTDFAAFNLQKGDMIALCDSTYNTQGIGTDVYTADIMFFDKFVTVPGPLYRMYFQQKATFTILCKDSLRWSQVKNIAGRSVTVKNLNIDNGGLYFNGFEYINVHDCNFTTDYDSLTANHYSSALSFSFCRYAFFNNILAKNQTISGMGYGINPCDFEICSINNFTAINCKHGISTGNSNLGTLNHVLMVNNYYFTAEMGMESITRGINNHTGTIYEYYSNIYIENTYGGIEARAQNTIIKNYIAKYVNSAVRLAGAAIKLRKGFADIDGVWVYNSPIAIYFDDINCTTVRINNVNLYPGKEYLASDYGRLLYFNTPGIFLNYHIADSIFVSNCQYKYTGTIGTGYSPLSFSSWTSADSFYCNYLKVDNTDFNGFYYLILNGRTAVRTIEFNNCALNNFNYLMQSTSVDTTTTLKSFGDLRFNDCTIHHNGSTAYLWLNSYTRFKNLTFKDCVLYGTSPGILRNIYADTVSFIDNKFYRSTNKSTFSTNGNSNIIKRLKIIGNRISGDIQSTDIFDIDSDVSNTYIIGNYLDCNVKRLMQLSGTYVQIIDNTFTPDSSVGSPTGAKVYTNGNVTGSILNNTFLYNKDDGNYFYAFKFNAAGDSIYMAGNNFILGTQATKSSAARIIDVESGAKVKLGLNSIEGWTQTWLVENGTVSKSPMLWQRFRIDSLSTTNRTDTLSLYMGATEYVIPKK